MSCDGNCNDCSSKCAEQAPPVPAEKRPEGGCAPSKCDSCPSIGNCGSTSIINDEITKISKRISKFGSVLLILSGKGGVGKSTVATQLAFYLADRCGKHVGLMDIDVCGPSIPTMTSTVGSEINGTADGWAPIVVSPNLQTISIGFMLGQVDAAVIMRGPKKHGVIQQFLAEVDWDLDESSISNNFLIIDTPPGTTDEHLSIINLINQASRLCNPEPHVSAIIVSTPQEVALSDVRREINFCSQIHIEINGVIENMSGFVCPCCNKETMIFTPTTGGCQKLCQDYGTKFLGRIPMDPILMKASEQGVAWSQLIDNEDTSVGLGLFTEIVSNILK